MLGRCDKKMCAALRFLTQIGTVDTAQQRKELFDPGSTAEGISQADGDSSPSEASQKAEAAADRSSAAAAKKEI